MSATPILLRERAALCDTFEKYGADAPTLCQGWRTLDLAAHLVAREARSDAALGLVLPGPFARHLDHVMERYKARGYDTLVAMLRSGPPVMHRYGPLAAANVTENFIHHEDVRRANGEGARVIPEETEDVLWKNLSLGARLAGRRVRGAALVLQTSRGRERVVSKEGPRVVVSGPVGELALFMSGRKEAAEVQTEGDHAAVAIVLAAQFGI